MSTQTKILKFAKHWRGYNPGEVAGFDAATADALERAKIAEAHDPGEEAKKPSQRQQGGTSRRASAKPTDDGKKSDAGTSTAQDGDNSTSTASDATSTGPDATTDTPLAGGPTDNDDRP